MRATLVAAWLLGCTDGDTTDSEASGTESSDTSITTDPLCPAGPLSLVPGTGEFGFEPFDKDGAIEMVNGEQGGWHLWTAGQLCNTGPNIAVSPTIVEVEHGIGLSGTQDTDAPVYFTLVDNVANGQYNAGARSGSFYKQYALIDDLFADLPVGVTQLDAICNLSGADIDFTIAVTDVDSGETDSETTRLRMRLDPDNVDQCH